MDLICLSIQKEKRFPMRIGGNFGQIRAFTLSDLYQTYTQIYFNIEQKKNHGLTQSNRQHPNQNTFINYNQKCVVHYQFGKPNQIFNVNHYGNNQLPPCSEGKSGFVLWQWYTAYCGVPSDYLQCVFMTKVFVIDRQTESKLTDFKQVLFYTKP